MSRTAEFREIDGMKFQVQQLGGRQAGRLFVRINGYLIPALAEVAGAVKGMSGVSVKSILKAELNIGGIVEALSNAAKTLFEKLTEDEYENLLKILLETARIEKDGKLLPLWPLFDDLMAGKVLTQVKLLQFALELNFADFWPALAGLKTLTPAGALDSETSSTSKTTGPAGV